MIQVAQHFEYRVVSIISRIGVPCKGVSDYIIPRAIGLSVTDSTLCFAVPICNDISIKQLVGRMFCRFKSLGYIAAISRQHLDNVAAISRNQSVSDILAISFCYVVDDGCIEG